MTAKLSAAAHRARGTPYRRPAAPAVTNVTPPATPADAPPPLEPLGPAGARLYAWAWKVWAAVLTESDTAMVTNLALLADAAADMDRLYAEVPPDKKAMSGRLRVSARFRFTAELARITRLAEEAANA